MLSQFSYPIICTDRFERTAAFYEDYFDFYPAFEMEGLSVFKRNEWKDMYVAFIDYHHEAIPEHFRTPVKGMILNYPVKDVQAAYQDCYFEGLNIVSEPSLAICGRNHFFVEDPNGILIDIAEDIDLEAVLGSAEKVKDLCFVV